MKESFPIYETNLNHRNIMLIPLLFAYFIYSLLYAVYGKDKE